jgi:hypothetical protein
MLSEKMRSEKMRLALLFATKEMDLPTNLNSDRARAEALFKKEMQLREGEKAMAEYRAAQQALREKTTRLRALRLARDGGAH